VQQQCKIERYRYQYDFPHAQPQWAGETHVPMGNRDALKYRRQLTFYFPDRRKEFKQMAKNLKKREEIQNKEKTEQSFIPTSSLFRLAFSLN